MENTPKYDYLLELVKNRRTIRQFKSDPVPDEYITKIIEVARWAPSGFHTQPWEFVVIKDPAVKNRVAEALTDKAPPIQDPAKQKIQRKSFRDAPVFILALCDWRARAGLPVSAPEITPHVINLYTSSMANVFLYMHLAANALGLASQWYTATSRPGAEEAIREIIGFPKELTIYDMLVLGYPAVLPGPKIVRDTHAMLHFDACGVQDFRTAEQVAEYAALTRAWCLSEH
jgi:nitroreductase